MRRVNNTNFRYPEVQKRVQKELDDVIGSERHLMVNEKQNLPYTEVFVWWSSIWRIV